VTKVQLHFISATFHIKAEETVFILQNRVSKLRPTGQMRPAKPFHSAENLLIR